MDTKKTNDAGEFPFLGQTFQIEQSIFIFGGKNGGRGGTFAPRNSKSSNRTTTPQIARPIVGLLDKLSESHVKFPDRNLIYEKRRREPQNAQEAQKKDVPLVLHMVAFALLRIFFRTPVTNKRSAASSQ